jgi:hypothetical protein
MAGLDPQERVVVSGLQRVRQGIEVRPEVVPMPVLSDPRQETKETERQGGKEKNGGKAK